MRQATFHPVVIREVEELDWSIEPDELPMPLVRRRAAPRARTLAGVGGPRLAPVRDAVVDELTW